MNKTRPDADSHGSPHDFELELLAIEEQFIAEHEAGAAPRLATYVKRYPKYAQVLAAFITEYLAPTGTVAEEDGVGDAGVTGRPLGAGTQRALDAIFGTPEENRRVAEQRETYTVGDAKDGDKGGEE